MPESLAAALGLSGTVPEPSVPPAHQPDAVLLINRAISDDDLTPLPGIGKGAAKRILAAAPELGYDSLEQLRSLVPEIFEPPYSADLAELEAWENA